jgi:hypothetical protein
MTDWDTKASTALQTCMEECFKRSKILLIFALKNDEMFKDRKKYMSYQTYVYEDIRVPEPVEMLVLEANVKNLILPNTLQTIQYMPYNRLDIRLNLPPHIYNIWIKYANFIGIEFHELFPRALFSNSKTPSKKEYYYAWCTLNGIELITIINTKYEKYFGKAPRDTNNLILDTNAITMDSHNSIIQEIIEYESYSAKYTKYFSKTPLLYNQLIDTNNNLTKHPNYIIDEVIEYEARIKQGREFRLAVKEELVAMAWHPRRVDRWIHADIDLLDL